MKYFSPILSLLFLFSCGNDSACDNVDGIYVAPVLSKQALKTGFSYCGTLEKSLQKDENAILQFIRFAYKTDDDSAIDHGIVFAELALKLGDDYMLEYLKKQLHEHQVLAAKMLQVCEEFRDPPLGLVKKLPKTADFISELEE